MFDYASNDERQQLLIKPTKLAAEHRDELLPVVGAGLSIPLGIPSWSVLGNELAKATGIRIDPGETAPQWMERVRAENQAFYYDRIRSLLTGPVDRTTKALQALAASGTGALATLNLDYSIEAAFELNGNPLKPHRVQLNAAKVDSDIRNPQLIKLHGSLHNPDSWVMTQGDYDRWYYSETRMLSAWWHQLDRRPLFIGCGMEDHEIQAIVHGLSFRNKKSGYILLSIEAARHHSAKLRQIGLMPIGLTTFDAIPGIIDEIFGCAPLKIQDSRLRYPEVKRTIRVGAASVICSERLSKSGQACVEMIANLVEVQTLNPLAGRSRGRRNNATLKDIVEHLSPIAEVPNSETWIAAAAEALWTYSDVYAEHFIRRLCRAPDLGMKIWPHVLKRISHARKKQTTDIIREVYESKENFNLRIRKVLANVLARDLGEHEAIAKEPTVVRVTLDEGYAIEIMPYHLTVRQTSILLGTKGAQKPEPLKPHVLEAPFQIAEIVAKLNDQSGGFRWRLPTVHEWKQCAHRSKSAWPWGSEPPVPGRHANLRFVSEPKDVKVTSGVEYSPVQGVPQEPIEVGSFLPGRSPDGLFDLIGNVYDLVWHCARPDGAAWNSLLSRLQNAVPLKAWTTSSRKQISLKDFGCDLRLAGGSFTSSYINGDLSSFDEISEIGFSKVRNIGLRFVRERKTP